MKLTQIDTAIYYPVDVPSTGKTTSFRPFTVGEEKGLLTAQESEDVAIMMTTLEATVRSCVVDCPDELTTFDVEWLFLKIRAKSVGEDSRVLITCPHCKTINNIGIDVTKAVLTNVADSMRIKLNENLIVQMKYPSITAIAKISKLTGDAQVHAAIASAIDTVYFGSQVMRTADTEIEDVLGFVMKRTSLELEKLTAFIDATPTVELNTEYECRQCAELNEVKLSTLADFF